MAEIAETTVKTVQTMSKTKMALWIIGGTLIGVAIRAYLSRTPPAAG